MPNQPQESDFLRQLSPETKYLLREGFSPEQQEMMVQKMRQQVEKGESTLSDFHVFTAMLDLLAALDRILSGDRSGLPVISRMLVAFPSLSGAELVDFLSIEEQIEGLRQMNRDLRYRLKRDRTYLMGFTIAAFLLVFTGSYLDASLALWTHTAYALMGLSVTFGWFSHRHWCRQVKTDAEFTATITRAHAAAKERLVALLQQMCFIQAGRAGQKEQE